MGEHQRGAIGALDHFGRSERFPRAGHTQQDLMFFARLDAARKLFDRFRLVAARLVVAHEFEVHCVRFKRALNHSREPAIITYAGNSGFGAAFCGKCAAPDCFQGIFHIIVC